MMNKYVAKANLSVEQKLFLLSLLCTCTYTNKRIGYLSPSYLGLYCKPKPQRSLAGRKQRTVNKEMLRN